MANNQSISHIENFKLRFFICIFLVDLVSLFFSICGWLFFCYGDRLNSIFSESIYFSLALMNAPSTSLLSTLYTRSDSAELHSYGSISFRDVYELAIYAL